MKTTYDLFWLNGRILFKYIISIHRMNIFYFSNILSQSVYRIYTSHCIAYLIPQQNCCNRCISLNGTLEQQQNATHSNSSDHVIGYHIASGYVVRETARRCWPRKTRVSAEVSHRRSDINHIWDESRAVVNESCVPVFRCGSERT